MSPLNGRIVVVTGASSGIGAALCERLGLGGAAVVLAARREPELRAVAARSGAGALAVATDVTRRDDVQRLFAAALARHGRVDAWVNNAGRGITRPVSALTDADVDEMMRVNLLSALYGMQVVLPHFRERGTGHIVNVSSMLGRVPFAPARSAYMASKHALNALTAGLRMELREKFPQIHVSTVSPPVVATEFGVNALGGGFDSRTFPNAQSAAEVAAVIADVLEHPRADVYTRPAMKQLVVDYYADDDMAAAEARLQIAPPPRP